MYSVEQQLEFVQWIRRDDEDRRLINYQTHWLTFTTWGFVTLWPKSSSIYFILIILDNLTDPKNKNFIKNSWKICRRADIFHDKPGLKWPILSAWGLNEENIEMGLEILSTIVLFYFIYRRCSFFSTRSVASPWKLYHCISDELRREK